MLQYTFVNIGDIAFAKLLYIYKIEQVLVFEHQDGFARAGGIADVCNSVVATTELHNTRD